MSRPGVGANGRITLNSATLDGDRLPLESGFVTVRYERPDSETSLDSAADVHERRHTGWGVQLTLTESVDLDPGTVDGLTFEGVAANGTPVSGLVANAGPIDSVFIALDGRGDLEGWHAAMDSA